MADNDDTGRMAGNDGTESMAGQDGTGRMAVTEGTDWMADKDRMSIYIKQHPRSRGTSNRCTITVLYRRSQCCIEGTGFPQEEN